MANVVKLGERPKSFKHTVIVPMLDGSEGAIPVVFKYRTVTEFGEMVDEVFKDAGEKPPKNGEFSMKSLMEKTRDKNADYLSCVLEGWGLDAPFGKASLVQLCDELPGAAAAVMDAYRAACREGRLGN